ncbi:Ig-like domain-containing protein [Bifidobacterium boum]|uniref:SpaA isopeptide-forming pilin-related protein n=1 Tax=Bifidobacterium boum TaxID=78343 RepID=UPI001F3F7F6D|nr:SpaA isopeptide-forming pilin-related protein [Bifidobacterium boum]MCF2561890.1 Ig-like domain-containing protein [Bifidobacterium boum]
MILPPIIAIDSRRAATAAGTNTAGLCDPTTNVSYGDGSTDITASDTGIATYVGGNMYIGSPKSDAGSPKSDAKWNAEAINGSYAAEAEGQTVVRGDLLARPIKKGSDGKSFFTLGMVAFGAQYLPAAGTTILAVGGKVGSNPGAISTLGGGDTDHAQAWNAPVGIKSKATKTSKEYDYKAYIAGKQSTVWGDPATPSVRAYTNTASNAVTWSGTTGLAGSGIVGATKKQSDIASLSENLSSLTSTGVVTTGVAPTGSYTRYKYDSSKSYGMTFTNDTVNYTVGSQTYSGINNEKVLFFAGDGHSNNQVFNVTVSQLNSDGYRGLDFAFSNIPANASVIINVVKDDGSSLENTDTVSFNTGWRFWWNNDEISNGYVTSGDHAADSSISNAYATAGESIMWNFGDAKSVTIGGGKAYEGLKAAGGRDDNASLDDPAAAMLGSILVPSGSFDDHATTNGRVWVGGDFMMNNPTGNANGASTASVIDMDQERHNLPWGMSSSSCSAIGWWKYGSDVSGVRVGGSSWGVFATYDDANNDTNAILYVTDDASNDWASANGRLEVHGLNINATYYVREVSPPDGYQNNNKVYTVKTTSEWAADSADSADSNKSNKYVNGVYMVQGDTDSKGNPECGINIYNICDAPSSVSWKKVASDGTTLSGSKWSLTNTGTNAEYEVDDLAAPVTGLTFTASTGTTSLGLVSGNTNQTKVTVTSDSVTSAIRYASTDPDVASISSTGLVTGHAVGSAQVIAYAGDKTATILVRVVSSSSPTSSGSGDSISIRGASVMQPHEQQKLMLRQGGVALPDPSVATWTSSDATVATVNGGNVTTGDCTSASGCQVTITAQYQGYTDTFNITVASSNVVTWKNPITIYYYTPRRPSWNAYYLHYAFVKNGSAVFDNTDIKMDSACSNWVKATVTNADALPLVVTFTDGSGTSTNAHWDSNNSKNYYLGAGYDTYVFDQESNGTNHTAPSCSVTSLSVTGNNVAKDGTMTMQANTTSQLNAIITPTNAVKVTWTSDNTAVATVDGTGLVTAIKAGTATIAVTAGGRQTLINLTVQPQTDGEVIVDGNDEMIVGRTQTLTAQLDGEKKVTITDWTSSDDSKAKVDSNGLVTALSTGKVTITASGYDADSGPNSGTKTGTMTLNIVATPPYWNDTDAISGQFTVKGLPDGSYKLCETTPPSGYAAGDSKGGTCYTFTLSAGKLVASTIPSTGVPNTPTTVTWSKVDADDTTEHLSGSAWKITSQDGKSVWCVVDGGTTTSTVTNCTTSGSGKVLADDDASDGIITVKKLPAGTYTLNEVQAPSGYELSKDSYTMVVSGMASKKSTVGDSDTILNSKTYGRVRWAKYDETAQSDGTHQALKGSDWQLFRCKSDVTSPSATACTESVKTFDGTSSSTFEYDSLLLNTYYLLVETKAPDGYLLGDAPYYAVKATSAATPATITSLSYDSAVQGRVDTRESNGAYPIYNRKAATAKWKKTEYGSGTALEGSEWKLVQYADKKSSTTESSALRVYKITYTAPTGSATQGSYAMSCTVGADSKNRCSTRYAGKLSVTSPEGASAKSVFSVSGLPWGYYVLTETKAPSGHLIGDDIARKSVGGKTASAVFTADYGTVTNEATITSLPMTGGEWTPRNVVIAGLIVLGVAAVSYGIARRRRRK